MNERNVGVFLLATSAQTLETVVRAEELGVPAVWLGTGGARPDALTLLAAAAVRTRAIKLGTAIVPTFPRHPIVTAQQAEVVAGLAPGRFVLGLGPSHKPMVERSFGIPFERPLEHLREYVAVVRALLQDGKVDFEGRRFHVHAQQPNVAPVPIMISALRRQSFELAGEVADGAISYMCPARYLRSVALPALEAGAAKAKRPMPLLVGHAFVVVNEDADQVVRVLREDVLAPYINSPFYAQMLVAAGFPEAEKGKWSNRMIDAVAIHGRERDVAAGLRAFMDTAGASEMMAGIVPVGRDEAASVERALRLVASLSSSQPSCSTPSP